MRIRENLRSLDEAFGKGNRVRRLEVEGGWYAVLRIPATARDEETALKLLKEHGIAIHSGDFFGFGASGWLVVSLLPLLEIFIIGMSQIADYLQRKHEGHR